MKNALAIGALLFGLVALPAQASEFGSMPGKNPPTNKLRMNCGIADPSAKCSQKT